MTDQSLIQNFPKQRIKPTDGMAVTAAVWQEAHDYHRALQRSHNLLLHGTGIVMGLDVIASDPPDTLVYITPGIAIDAQGQAIVISQPVAFNLGDQAEGNLHLLLLHDESRPRPLTGQGDDSPLYVREQFSIHAARALPDAPCVELARLQRVGRDASIRDAADPQHPDLNELDLRFRVRIDVPTRQITTVAVCYMTGDVNESYGRGIHHLARALTQEGKAQVQVADAVSLSERLDPYTLVVLEASAPFQPRHEVIDALQALLQKGGTILMESTAPDSRAEEAFHALAQALEVELRPLSRDHPLLTEPFLFAAPPAGYEHHGELVLHVGEGIILSPRNYGRLWRGEQRDRTPPREEIRSATEWGRNIIEYAQTRRRAHAS